MTILACPSCWCWAGPVRATLLLPACSTLALLCSQVRPDCHDSDITQQAIITNITPSESLIWVLNLWCFFASQHFICTPTMTDMVWRPSADPECPPYEHSQVSPVQVWLWSDLYAQVPRSHKRLVLQTLCWIMLATGAFAITTVMISSIYSLFYVMVNCRIPP